MIIAAFAANLGIAILKFTAFVFTASSSMLSEAIHSVADTINQTLLLVGRRRAQRPPDDHHPFGYGPLRYFYAFIVAVVIFAAGGLFSLYEGIDKLRHPHSLDNLWWAIGVLLGAMVMEGFSFRTARAEANEVRPAGESWWQFIRRTKSPDLPVLLLEDTAALIGLVFAFLGVTLSKLTDNARWDGAGSVAIGLLLVAVAVVLVIEMSSLLVGESARPQVVAAIQSAIENHQLVKRVIHLRTEHIGPEEIMVAAKIEFDHSLSVTELSDAIDSVEVDIRAAEPRATLIFLEPDVYRPT